MPSARPCPWKARTITRLSAIAGLLSLLLAAWLFALGNDDIPACGGYSMSVSGSSHRAGEVPAAACGRTKNQAPVQEPGSYHSGDEGARTPDPDTASVVLSQLSYVPDAWALYQNGRGNASVVRAASLRHWADFTPG